LSARGVLFIGFLLSVIYITLIVYFQTSPSKTDVDKSTTSKFLYVQNKNSLEVISKLSKEAKNSSLVKKIKQICQVKNCQINFSFDSKNNDKSFYDFMNSLVIFANEANITKAAIIADGKKVELNFLLNTNKELTKLKSINKEYQEAFSITDNSSILEYFSVRDIENSINDTLKSSSIDIKDSEIDFKTKRVLNTIFRKLKALGSLDVDLYLDLDEDKQKILIEYIKKSYPWVSKVKVIKDKNKKIKIKEVLT